MTASTNPALPPNVWGKTLGAIVLYLALVLVPAIVALLVFHVALGHLIGPYLAFALPIVIFMPLIVGLRAWEGRGAPHRRLALAWSVLMGLFGVWFGVADFYAAGVLGIFDPMANLDAVVATILIGTIVAVLTGYFSVREILARRAGASASSMRRGM